MACFSESADLVVKGSRLNPLFFTPLMIRQTTLAALHGKLDLIRFIIFIEAKREKLKDAEGKYFYSKICGLVLLALVIGFVFSILGYSSKIFLLACTNTLVASSKLLERIKVEKNYSKI